MQFPQSQCCNNATYQDNCFTGCGQTMPIVPGTNPALQTWNGQFFVVSDGSAQNRISLPFLQVNGGAATYVVGADNNGTLSYYSPVVESVKNLIGGFAGYLPYQSAANTTTFLPIGTAGQILKVSNTGLPQWSAFTATSAQNISGGAAGQVVYQTAPSTTGFTAQGTTGQVLTSAGTGSPTWTSQSALSVGNATTAVNFTGSLSGDVTGTQSATSVSLVGGVSAANVATGANSANASTDANTASTIVKRDASGNFSAGTITASLSGNATTATTANISTNVTGGLAGSLPYQTAASTTTTLGIGTANQLLTVNSGATAPIWQTGIIGITNASNAASGFVGQTLSGTLTFTGTTTGAIVRCVETIAVNAGDWDIYAYVTFSYSGTTTAISTIGASIGTATNAFTPLQQTIQLVGVTAALTQTDAYSFVTPLIRVNVSATTNYYVVIKLPTFSAGTITVTGSYRGRRVR